MREYIIWLLKTLEILIPPDDKCHHSITFVVLGSQEKLCLNISKDGKWQTMFLDREDFYKSYHELANEIAKAVNQ